MKKPVTRVEYQRKNRRENLITVILVIIIIIIGAVALVNGTHTKFNDGATHKSNHQSTTKVVKHKHHRKHHHKLAINNNTQNPNNPNSGNLQNSNQSNQPVLRHRSSTINSSDNTNNDVSIHKNNPIVKPQKPVSKPTTKPTPTIPSKTNQQNVPSQKTPSVKGSK